MICASRMRPEGACSVVPIADTGVSSSAPCAGRSVWRFSRRAARSCPARSDDRQVREVAQRSRSDVFAVPSSDVSAPRTRDRIERMRIGRWWSTFGPTHRGSERGVASSGVRPHGDATSTQSEWVSLRVRSGPSVSKRPYTSSSYARAPAGRPLSDHDPRHRTLSPLWASPQPGNGRWCGERESVADRGYLGRQAVSPAVRYEFALGVGG